MCHLDANIVVHHGVSVGHQNKNVDQDEKDVANVRPKDEEAVRPLVKAAVQEEVDAHGGDDDIRRTITAGVAQAAVAVTVLLGEGGG